jgi:ABC-2 type transport system permease protein
MEMLLAQPLSRWQVVVTQGTVTVYSLAILAMAVWTGITAGIQTFKTLETGPQPSFRVPGLHVTIPIPWAKPERQWVPLSKVVQVEDYLPATLNLFCFGVCLAGVATGLSAFDRYRWRTIGITVGLYVMQMMVKLGATAVPELKWLNFLTIFSAYQPQRIVERAVHAPETAWSFAVFDNAGHFTTLGPLGCDALLLGIGLLGYAAAVIQFSRRDIPAPL